MKKLEKNRHMHDRLHLLAAILALWRHPVASIKALDLLHRAMFAVLSRCTPVAIKMASKVGPFFCCCVVCCCPGGCWGNREQVVTQWQHPGGSPDSPGHAAMGNAVCIAPAHRRGHQNGQQRRCIFSSSLILSSTITMAK
jgi:hypothetical protein